MKYLSLFGLLLVMVGCSTVPEPDLEMMAKAKAEVNQVEPQQIQPVMPLPRKGSMFQAKRGQRNMLALFADRRAYRPGDVLTVMLNERTQSSKRAGSSLGKETDITTGVPFAGALTTRDFDLSLNSSSEFDGSSEANQENFLQGAISVRVESVLPSGLLKISGKKHLKLNQGDEYIQLDGYVRPEDIDVSNRVSSQRIAEANISYYGEGDLAKATRPGWFTRLFNNYLNPF